MGDLVAILGLERYPEEGMATHSCILAWRIPMDRGSWQTTVHTVAKSWTLLKQLTTMNTLLHNMPMSNVWYLCIF